MNTSRVWTLIFVYKIAKIFNMFASAVFSYWVAQELSHNLLTFVLISGFISLSTWVALNIVTLVFIQLFVSTEHLEQALDELSDHEGQTVDSNCMTITIVNRAPKVMGYFQGEEFWEWIDVETASGSAVRFKYDGTQAVISDQEPMVPDDCLLLPPGILYRQAATPMGGREPDQPPVPMA